jgi:hypothetical protein
MSRFSLLRRLTIVVAFFVSLTVATTQVAGAAVCDAAWRVQSTAALPADAVLHDVAVTGQGETWVVGESGARGLLARFSNGSWTTSRYGIAGQLVSIRSVDAQPGVAWAIGVVRPDVFQFGSPIVLVNTGAGWKRMALPATVASAALRSVVIRNSNDVWIAGSSGNHPLAVHWDGSRLIAETLTFTGFGTGIEAPPDGGVVMVGNSFSPYGAGAWHRNGYGWVQDRVPPQSVGEEFATNQVDGTRTNAWAVGFLIGGCCGTFSWVHRWNGSRWIDRTPATGTAFLDVLVPPRGGHVFAVGQSSCGDGCIFDAPAEVWEWDGATWTNRPVRGLSQTIDSRLVAVDGDGNGNRWAVGNRNDFTTGDFRPIIVRQCA